MKTLEEQAYELDIDVDEYRFNKHHINAGEIDTEALQDAIDDAKGSNATLKDFQEGGKHSDIGRAIISGDASFLIAVNGVWGADHCLHSPEVNLAEFDTYTEGCDYVAHIINELM